MKNRNLLLLFALFLGSLGGCKKKHCYSCRDVLYIQYWVKGIDTVKVIHDATAIPKSLPDSGYTIANYEQIWQPYLVTYCEVDEHDFTPSYLDSCYITD